MDASYLSEKVTAIIGQLHGLFDEIGVANHEREVREAQVGTVPSTTGTGLADAILVIHGSVRDAARQSAPRDFREEEHGRRGSEDNYGNPSDGNITRRQPHPP